MVIDFIKKVYHSRFLNTPHKIIPLNVTKLLIFCLDIISQFRFSQVRTLLLRQSGIIVGSGSKICGGDL